MFIESEIMMAAIKEANSSGIVAYPVHDCLMCKQADEDIVVKAIQKGMMAKLGSTIMMDVSYSDKPSKIILPLGETLPATLKSRFTYPEDDDDFEVIEYT